MKYEMPEPGKQFKPCPKCEGQMEFRLGIWDCGMCGHTETPGPDPLDAIKPDPTAGVNRAKLIRREDAAGTSAGSFGEDSGTIHRRRELSTDPLSTRLMCIGGHILLAILAHGYTLMQGSRLVWIDTEYIIMRIGLQVLYVFLIGVGLIWREALTKYIAMILSVGIFIALLALSFMRFDLVPDWEFFNGPLFPQVEGWYWLVLAFLHTGLFFWLFSIVMKDMGEKERSRGPF